MDETIEHASLMCPSGQPEPGALLIGVRAADGTVRYLRDRLPVDAAFLARLGPAGNETTRYRFSSPCREHVCAQWSDGRCSLPEALAAVVTPLADLPHCAIRRSCRWFAQSGPTACGVCPLISTRAPVTAVSTGEKYE